MSPTKTVSATERLAELRQAVATANVAVRAVEDERRAAERKREALRGAVVAAYADGDADRAQRIADDLAALDDDLSASAIRAEGAQLAARRATQALGRFAAENLDALLEEQRDAAENAREGVAAALRAIASSVEAWQAAASDVLALAHLAGRSDVPARVPSLPPSVEYVLAHARRIDDAAVPAPFPIAAVVPGDAADLDARAA